MLPFLRAPSGYPRELSGLLSPGGGEGEFRWEAQDAGHVCALHLREAELPGLGGRCCVGQLSPPGATKGE